MYKNKQCSNTFRKIKLNTSFEIVYLEKSPFLEDNYVTK